MQEYKERKNGIILSYISIILNVVIQLIYLPFLITKLGDSEYGIYSIVASIMGYLAIMDFGFGDAIVLYTSKYRAQKKFDDEKKLHGMFQLVFIIIAIITVIIGTLLSLKSHLFFSSSMTSYEVSRLKILLLILTGNLAITFGFSLYGSILKAYEKFTYQKLIAISNSVLQPIIMIPLLLLGFKSIALCMVITILNIYVNIANYIYCKKKLKIKLNYKNFDKKLFKTIATYSFYVFLNIVVDKINWSTDQFVLGIVAGTKIVTIYSIAAKINDLFLKLSTAISSVLFSKISKMVAKNENDEIISNEFIKTGRIQHYIMFLMTSGLVLFGKTFFSLWVGKKYITSYYVALILIIPLSIPLIQNLGISILKAKNMHKFRSVLYVIIAIFNIIISIPLSIKYGAIGAAIGTAIPLIIGNIIIINIYYYKKAGLNIIKFWKEIIRITIPLLVPVILIILFMNLLKLNGLISFITYGSIYTILYSIFAYKLSMNEYEKNIVKKFLKKLHLKKV